MLLSDEQLQEWARQAAFSTMGDVREVLDRVVAMTAEACAAVCDDKAQKYAGRGLYPNEVASLHCAAAIREKAREGK